MTIRDEAHGAHLIQSVLCAFDQINEDLGYYDDPAAAARVHQEDLVLLSYFLGWDLDFRDLSHQTTTVRTPCESDPAASPGASPTRCSHSATSAVQ